MECVEHPGVEPVARCVECGALLCERCAQERDGHMYCAGCAPAVQDAPPRKQFRISESLDISRAFTYVFEDPEWPLKILIGGLFVLASVLIVPAFFLLGYMVEVVRRAERGEDSGLPPWDDLGTKFKLGAKLLLAELVYGLPMLIVFAGTFVLGFLFGEGARFSGVRAVAQGFAFLAFFMGWLLVIALSLLLRLALPAITGRLARTDSLEKTLQVGTVVGMVRSDLASYLVVLVLTVFVTSMISFLGLAFCCVGVLFTSFYALMVNAHFYGQLSRLCPVED